MDKIRLVGLGLVVALVASGCAPMGHFLADLDTQPKLEAWGPGTVFPSVEAAAVDALIYVYLQASNERDTERMRAGTIYSVETGYSYPYYFSRVFKKVMGISPDKYRAIKKG